MFVSGRQPITTSSMKKIVSSVLIACVLALGVTSASAADTAPKSVIHVVTVSWKADATPAQIQAALDGVKALPAGYPGITRVWVKTIKAQGNRQAAFVMEFKDEQALKDYTNSAAQKKWYEVYLPVREASTTFDISN